MVQGGGQLIFQGRVALALGRHKADDRDAQLGRKLRCIDFNALLRGYIHQVQNQHGRDARTDEIRQHVQRPFQLGTVHQDRHQVGLAGANVPGGDDLLL